MQHTRDGQTSRVGDAAVTAPTATITRKFGRLEAPAVSLEALDALMFAADEHVIGGSNEKGC